MTALDRAAFRLFQLAGRPDGLWEGLSEYEREAWRHIVRELAPLLRNVDLLDDP